MGVYDDAYVTEASFEDHPVYKRFMKACKDAGIAMDKADDALRKAYIKSRDRRYHRAQTDVNNEDVLILVTVVLAGTYLGLPRAVIRGIIGTKMGYDLLRDVDNWAEVNRLLEKKEVA